MKLKAIEIRGLYGHFDYTIELSDDKALILTGLNGYGKTTILRLIDSLAKKDLYFFYVTPFETVSFLLDDDSVILVKSAHAKQNKRSGKEDERLSLSRALHFEWRGSKNSQRRELLMDEESISWAHHNLSKYGDMDDSHEVNYQSMDFYAAAKIANLPQEIASLQGKAASQLMMLLGTIKTYLIEAERTVLYRNVTATGNIGAKQFEIDACNFAFRQYMKAQYEAYRKNANVLDEQFVDNALKLEKAYTESEYQAEAEKLKVRKTELEKMGLIDFFEVRPYSESNAKMLSAYIISQNRKLDFHNDLLERLRMFADMMESKRFVNKNLTITKDGGIRFLSDGGGYIDLNRLSSGEQNEVIMLYYLIFNVKDGSTLLIDEPETSLHVLWQNEYVANIERIARQKDLSVIISTHSPQIIGSRWDECYDLTEMSSSHE